MNETNRTAIVLLAAAVIVLMAVVVFLAWTEASGTVARLQDFVQFLDDHRDNASRLILTLGALVVIVLALLIIIFELAPEEETRDLRLAQAGTTTIVPALALQQRLEEALLALPMITAARARVSGGDKGIATNLDLTIAPDANVAAAAQEAARVVVDTLQTDLGLPVAAPPTVRIAFGEAKAPAGAPTAASSLVQPPVEPDAVPAPPLETPQPPAWDDVPEATPAEPPLAAGDDRPAEAPTDLP